MGLIRKQIGSDSPKKQVDKWFTKHAKYRVLFGTFYHPDEVLFKVKSRHSYVFRQLMELHMCGELNEFMIFDFSNTYGGIEINIHSSGPHHTDSHHVANIMSTMDKHLLNLDKIFVHDYSFDGEYKTFIIKRYGEGDWRVEPD